jgi:hypothetical protein
MQTTSIHLRQFVIIIFIEYLNSHSDLYSQHLTRGNYCRKRQQVCNKVLTSFSAVFSTTVPIEGRQLTGLVKCRLIPVWAPYRVYVKKFPLYINLNFKKRAFN